MIQRVLGIDIASAELASIGSAGIYFDDDSKIFTSVIPGMIPWPQGRLTPVSLADTIDAFVREYGVSAVALDGPQGWRDPNTRADEFGGWPTVRIQSRPQESEQEDKWSFCLTVGTLCPANQERP
jgi:hypothetical protein